MLYAIPKYCLEKKQYIYYIINDITDKFTNVSAKLFADDVKIYTRLSSSSPAATTNFQHHLDLIQSWATIWQMGISYAKCNILQIGTHRNHQVYSISNHTLQSSSPIKDLGVLIDSKLKFNHHIVNFVNRARQRASLIFRGFLSRDTSHLIRAFTSYVRPLVEYASPVWSPSYIHLINEIESVQRAFTRRLPGLKQLTYTDRLTILKLKSLEHRRLISDLILCFKIVRGFTSVGINEMFIPSRNTSSRGHSFRLEVPLAKCNTRNHFFACRIVRVWNALPQAVVSSPNVLSFKKLVNKLDLSKFLHFPCVLS